MTKKIILSTIIILALSGCTDVFHSDTNTDPPIEDVNATKNIKLLPFSETDPLLAILLNHEFNIDQNTETKVIISKVNTLNADQSLFMIAIDELNNEYEPKKHYFTLEERLDGSWQVVKKGEKQTGIHLHVKVHKNGVPIDTNSYW